LEKVLALISNVNQNQGNNYHQKNEDDIHNETINEESKECAGNMTMSEL